jgi:hypothetical protein
VWIADLYDRSPGEPVAVDGDGDLLLLGLLGLQPLGVQVLDHVGGAALDSTRSGDCSTSAPFSSAAEAAVGSPPSRRGRGSGTGRRERRRPGDRIERSTERDAWLTSRRRACTRRLDVLWETPVEHEPWPLAAATMEVLEGTLIASAGLPAPSGGPVVHFSEGVRDVRLGAS